MSRVDKTLQGMRENLRDWRIDSLEAIAGRFDIQVRKSGGSHVVFVHEKSDLVVTVPAKRPIKAIYISQFFALLDDIGVYNHE